MQKKKKSFVKFTEVKNKTRLRGVKLAQGFYTHLMLNKSVDLSSTGAVQYKMNKTNKPLMDAQPKPFYKTIRFVWTDQEQCVF